MKQRKRPTGPLKISLVPEKQLGEQRSLSDPVRPFDANEPEIPVAISPAQTVLHTPGDPLDADTRAFMEPRFRHDFSKVRIHADGGAATSAQAINATAYTVGQNIVFDSGQYTPETDTGKRLLAHELAHVVQQSRGGTSAPPPLPVHPLEQAAQRAASTIVQGGTASVAGAGAPGIARQPRSLNETLNPTTMSDAELNQEIALIRQWLDENQDSSPERDQLTSALSAIETEVTRRNGQQNQADTSVEQASDTSAGATDAGVTIPAVAATPSVSADPGTTVPSAPVPVDASTPSADAGTSAPGIARQPRSLNESLDPTTMSDADLSREIALIQQWLSENQASSPEHDQLTAALSAMETEVARRGVTVPVDASTPSADAGTSAPVPVDASTPPVAAGPHVVATVHGTFMVYPDDFMGPLPLSDYAHAAGGWPVRQSVFSRIEAAINAISGGAGKITLSGSDTFKTSGLSDFAWLMTVDVGLDLLQALAASGKSLTINPTSGGNTTSYTPDNDSYEKPDHTPGPGADATINYNTTELNPYGGIEAWMTRPPAIGLAHELIHAWSGMIGIRALGETAGVRRRELQATGLGEFSDAAYSENRFRQAFGLPLRPHY